MADGAKYVQAQAFTLAGAGCTIGATSITLTSFAGIDGTALTMTDFGTKGFLTVEPGNGAREEQLSFTGVNQNANGTATLTGVSNVLFIAPYTESSGTTKSHPGGATVIITNTAGFYNRFASKVDDETITGTWDFDNFPSKNGVTTPTVAAQFATKAYVDATATGSAITNQVLVAGVAGESITAGQVVYFKTSDQRWWKADADLTATFLELQLGITQTTASAAGVINVLIEGQDSNQSGLSAGSTYYLSNTAGGISSTPGTNTVMIGRAISTTSIVVNFRQTDYALKTQVIANMVYGATSTGTDAYAITVTPAILAYAAGQAFYVKADVANTGAATLAVNGLSAITILKQHDQALVTGDIEAGQIFEVVYDGTNFQMMSMPSTNYAVAKFGGDGSDGALTVTSGTTSIDLAGSAFVVKNYTTISITGTGAVNFTNPHASGSVVVLKSVGDVTLTSSATPMLSGVSMGATGGAAQTGAVSNIGPVVVDGANGTAGATFSTYTGTSDFGDGAVDAGGTGGAKSIPAISQLVNQTTLKYHNLVVGAGGGSGRGVNASGSGNITSGAGGRGGGVIVIECGGAWNFTTSSGISVNGSNGGNGVLNSGTGTSTGGGGGGGGMFLAYYNTLTANSGSVTVAGGTGGNNNAASTAGSTFGGGGGASVITNGSNGTQSGTGSAKTGADGGAGYSMIAANTNFA